MEERALSTIIPHTTSSRNSRFEVRLNISFLRQGVFDTQNILTIPNVKLIKKLGSLTRDDMISIGSHVKLWLGL
jgi:mRNA interferase MazF